MFQEVFVGYVFLIFFFLIVFFFFCRPTRERHQFSARDRELSRESIIIGYRSSLFFSCFRPPVCYIGQRRNMENKQNHTIRHAKTGVIFFLLLLAAVFWLGFVEALSEGIGYIFTAHLFDDVPGNLADGEQREDAVQYVQQVGRRLRSNGISETFGGTERAMNFKHRRDGRGRDARQYLRAELAGRFPHAVVQPFPVRSDCQQFLYGRNTMNNRKRERERKKNINIIIFDSLVPNAQ